eukprot:9190554-Ditylum_brightwellii.AAC.1
MSRINGNTTALTPAQGGCEWHICCSGGGLITSTVVYTMLVATQRSLMDQEKEMACLQIGLTIIELPGQLLACVNLECLSVADINSLLQQKGLNRTRNKTVLINKLAFSDPVIPDVLQGLM